LILHGHLLGNADCTRIDLADNRKMLIDFANMRNNKDPWDRPIDLPMELRTDLRAAKRDYYDVVCFTHLDDDHCHGSGEFFWMDHAATYQGDDSIKIRELWVPAAAILEDGLDDCARVIRQEARHRLKKGSGIRVFSRPAKLKEWLEKNGLAGIPRAPRHGRGPVCFRLLNRWTGARATDTHWRREGGLEIATRCAQMTAPRSTPGRPFQSLGSPLVSPDFQAEVRLFCQKARC